MDVEKRTTISAGLDPSGVEQGAQRMSAAMTQSVQSIQRALLGSSAAFDAMKNKLVEGNKEALTFAQGLQTIWRAVQDGRDKLGQSTGMVDNLTRSFNLVGPAANNAKAAVAGLIDTTATAGQRLQAYQTLLTTFQTRAGSVAPGMTPQQQQQAETANRSLLGITDPDPQASAKRAADIEAYGKALDGLRASIDPVFARSKMYEEELNRIDQAEKLLLITSKQADVARDAAATGFAGQAKNVASFRGNLSQLTGTTGESQFAMRQLGVQAVQTFSGLATGQPIFMTLIQQGHQIVDVMLSSSTSVTALGKAFANFLSSLPAWVLITGAILAVGAAFAAMAISAERFNEQMGDLQNHLSGVRDDFAAMRQEVEQVARSLASTTSIGFSDALKAASTLANNPAFAGTNQQMADLVKLGQSLALTLGKDVPTAVKMLSDGMTDAGKVAQQLLDEDHLKGIDQIWVDTVKNMQARDPVQAFEMLRQGIERATKDATRDTTALTEAWHRFTEALTSSGGAIHAIGTFLDNMLAHVLDVLSWILEKLEKIRQYTPNIPESIRQGGLVIGNGPGGAGGGALSLTPGAGGSYASMFTEAEGKYGLPAGLLSAIGQRESGFDPSKVNADSGATGLMQILLSTAQKPGYGVAGITDAQRSDPAASIDFAARYIAALQAHLGSLDAAIKQYSGGGYSVAGSGVVAPPQTDITRAQQGSSDTLAARGADIQRRLDIQNRGFTAAFNRGDQDAMSRYGEEIRKLNSEMTNNISEQEKMGRTAKDALIPLNAQAGAARALAEVENQFRIAARDTNGGMVEQAALSEALRAKQAELTQQRKDEIDALDLQTNAQNAQNALIEIGGRAAEHAANFERANIEARKTAKQGTHEFAVAVVELTDAYDRNTEAKRNNAAESSIHAQEQQQELLQAEIRLVDASTEARERELAVIRTRQQLNLKPGEQANPIEQRAIEANATTAGMKVQADDLKASYNELANAASQSFDTIGSAMADAFLQGKDAAVSFQSVLKTVVQQIIQEMLKLAVINPILNSLFPGSGTRPTLDSVGSALGSSSGGLGSFFSSIFGGGTSAAVSAAANVNMSTSAFFGPGFARGGVFSGLPGMGSMPAIGDFANMIISQPTLFRAYAQGGVMGEAGPEAIMPLVRGPSGNLGVRGSGGGTAVVINTPITIQGNATGSGGKLDPQALAALQKQIEGAVKDAARRTIVDEKRPGGDLFGG